MKNRYVLLLSLFFFILRYIIFTLVTYCFLFVFSWLSSSLLLFGFYTVDFYFMKILMLLWYVLCAFHKHFLIQKICSSDFIANWKIYNSCSCNVSPLCDKKRVFDFVARKFAPELRLNRFYYFTTKLLVLQE